MCIIENLHGHKKDDVPGKSGVAKDNVVKAKEIVMKIATVCLV